MKKGFTLIELLAVIVIIAIITLITIPVVGNIIENSKKEAFKRSIEGLVREYEYKEVQTDTKLGSIDICTLQETCKIEGTIKRDTNEEIVLNVTDGRYCTNGKVDNLIITECDNSGNYNENSETQIINISSAIIEDIESVDYDGTEKTPEVEITLNGIVLVENIDYTLYYSNNINAGVANVTITGIGNYVGEITKTFIINRIDAINSEIVASILTYNGLSQSLIESVNISNSHVYYSVDTPLNSSNYLSVGSEIRPSRTDAGTYIVYYYAPSDNYNEVIGNITCTIKKAKATLSLRRSGSAINSITNDSYYALGEDSYITVNSSSSNYGTLSCSTSDTSVATCSVSDDVITVSPLQEGNFNLTIVGSGDNNYKSKTINSSGYVSRYWENTDLVFTYPTTELEIRKYNSSYSTYEFNTSYLKSQFTSNYRDIISQTGKNYFIGLRFECTAYTCDNPDKITMAYTCGVVNYGTSNEKLFCIDALTTYMASQNNKYLYYTPNVDILRNTFGSESCIDYGTAYSCGDNNYAWIGNVTLTATTGTCVIKYHDSSLSNSSIVAICE